MQDIFFEQSFEQTTGIPVQEPGYEQQTIPVPVDAASAPSTGATSAPSAHIEAETPVFEFPAHSAAAHTDAFPAGFGAAVPAGEEPPPVHTMPAASPPPQAGAAAYEEAFAAEDIAASPYFEPAADPSIPPPQTGTFPLQSPQGAPHHPQKRVYTATGPAVHPAPAPQPRDNTRTTADTVGGALMLVAGFALVAYYALYLITGIFPSIQNLGSLQGSALPVVLTAVGSVVWFAGGIVLAVAGIFSCVHGGGKPAAKAALAVLLVGLVLDILCLVLFASEEGGPFFSALAGLLGSAFVIYLAEVLVIAMVIIVLVARNRARQPVQRPAPRQAHARPGGSAAVHQPPMAQPAAPTEAPVQTQYHAPPAYGGQTGGIPAGAVAPHPAPAPFPGEGAAPAQDPFAAPEEAPSLDDPLPAPPAAMPTDLFADFDAPAQPEQAPGFYGTDAPAPEPDFQDFQDFQS
uniref:Uncharacterized protein n=1 Tax=termite gut metagenome TaxID=433724 RepID=S0DER9_9ZZZZ